MSPQECSQPLLGRLKGAARRRVTSLCSAAISWRKVVILAAHGARGGPDPPIPGISLHPPTGASAQLAELLGASTHQYGRTSPSVVSAAARACAQEPCSEGNTGCALPKNGRTRLAVPRSRHRDAPTHGLCWLRQTAEGAVSCSLSSPHTRVIMGARQARDRETPTATRPRSRGAARRKEGQVLEHRRKTRDGRRNLLSDMVA